MSLTISKRWYGIGEKALFVRLARRWKDTIDPVGISLNQHELNSAKSVTLAPSIHD